MKTSKDRYITNVSVKRDEIKDIRLLHGTNKTISQWYNETKADIIVNGALYSSNGIPIESYMTDGKVLSTSTWCKYGFGINWNKSVQFGEVNPIICFWLSELVWFQGKVNISVSDSLFGIHGRCFHKPPME